MEETKINKYNLTEGKIVNKLLLIALPILGTNIIEMIYNMADMFWLGNYLGSNAVASTGTGGMYMWMSMAFVAFGRYGGEIGVSQNIGRGDKAAAKLYARNSVVMATVLGSVFALVMITLRTPLIGFFGLENPTVLKDAETYMVIVACGVPFVFIGSAISGIFIGSGNSRIPFIANGVGLAVNMILDPVMIIGMGMGIAGAALSTIIGQILTALILIVGINLKKIRPFRVELLKKPNFKVIFQVVKWAFPISIESFLFTLLSMIMTRLVATWGEGAMASMRIGSQIDSLSWLISGSFASSLTSFVGQNFGAKKWDRINKGFKVSLIAMVIWGSIVAAIQFYGGGFIYRLFLPNEPDVVAIGVTYLKILACCQIFACFEGVVAGLFRGLGDTAPPSIVSITVNSLRLILAFILSSTSLGLNGVWVAIAIGAGCRGLFNLIWQHFKYRDLRRESGSYSPETAEEV